MLAPALVRPAIVYHRHRFPPRLTTLETSNSFNGFRKDISLHLSRTLCDGHRVHELPSQLPDDPADFRAGDLFAWVIGPAFLGLAAWFVLGSPRTQVPAAPSALVSRDLIRPGARRGMTGEPPEVVVGGFRHRCNECHRLFDSPPVDRRTLVQHTEIVLRHGMNDRCFNCHDHRDRERLVTRTGTIGFDEVPRLCAQCHGTVYRDWERGMHGKTMGSWDASSGAQRRLTCNECHDPHSPAYPVIAPLPGPNTLRMGDQSPSEGHGERHVPLRRWSSGLPGQDIEAPDSAPGKEHP